MGPARIYPWRRMHRSRAPSIAPGTFFVAQSWAGCITNMPEFNLRQAQGREYRLPLDPGRPAPSIWPDVIYGRDSHFGAPVISVTDRKTTLRYQTRVVRHWLALSQMLFTCNP